VPELSNLNGVWQGATSQGGGLRLTVENNTVKSVLVLFAIPDCQVNNDLSNFAAPITGNAFSASNEYIDISGTFNADGSASGTINIHPVSNNVVPCSGTISLTWFASK
jgi:hypothetical protein